MAELQTIKVTDVKVKRYVDGIHRLSPVQAGQFDTNNQSVVRIPMLLFIEPFNLSEDAIHQSLVDPNRFVRQIGTHLLSFNGEIRFFHSSYLPKQWGLFYKVSKLQLISCVYPIIRNNDITENRLCLGLFFQKSIQYGQRDFLEEPASTGDRGGVFNINEDIFETENIQHMTRQLNQVCVAIYVCAGARLILEDDRESRAMARNDGKLTRSLLQQGSFVIHLFQNLLYSIKRQIHTIIL